MCTNTERCPRCLGTNIKKNGYTSSLKQLNKCKDCKYKFVKGGQEWQVSLPDKSLIKRLLLERISLRGICRVMQISKTWLLHYIKELYAELPDDLNFKWVWKEVKHQGHYYIRMTDNEADELWSFVQNKDNVKYVWLVMHRESRQIICFEVGDRSAKTAQKLWDKIPEFIRKNGFFHTDDWDSYKPVIPAGQHQYCTIKKYTNHMERFNCTLRQRVSRLVRLALSFSKNLDNHIGAIAYFICDYNLQIQKSLAP